MDNNHRIVMLIARYYPVRGGAETQCQLLSKELKESGTEVFVLTQRLPGLPSYENIENIQVHRVGLPIAGAIGSLSYVISGFLWLRRNRHSIDILHAHLASSNAVLAALFSKYFKKPSFLKIGGSRKTGDLSTSLSSLIGRLKLQFLKGIFNAFIAPSREIKLELLEHGFSSNKIYIIPNGVDTDIFKPAYPENRSFLRNSFGLSKYDKIVVYTGRLAEGKGVEILINAWLNLEPSNNCLLILGDGPKYNELKEQAKGSGSIVFPGWKNNTADYLRASDIFVLPSYGEGMPNALLEAMACGLQCIATRIGGITDIIEDGKNGLLIEPRNVDQTAEALKKLLGRNSTTVDLGNNARAYIKDNYSIERISAKYLKLYKYLS